jgi:elongation factor Ts
MAVTIDQIKSLRNKTGVSMSACKKALEEANGSEEKAIEFLRKRGEAKALDRADRATGEGSIAAARNGKKVAMVKLACETDFTARSDEFIELVDRIASEIAEKGDVDFTQDVADLGSKVGEKIELADPVIVEDENVGFYIHGNRKLAGLVSLSGGDEELAKNVAMHITASAPTVVKPEDVDAAELEKERTIWKDELEQQKKPENIWDNIMQGKEKKFREDRALLTQAFVKNPDLTVGQHIEETATGTEVHEIHRITV